MLIEKRQVRTRYSSLGRLLRRLVRVLRPISKSPDYSDTADICAVRLVPEQALTEVYRKALRILGASARDGAYVEFGVFNGTSLACMSAAAASSNVQPFPMIGIDSFEGLPSEVSNEDGGVWTPGQFACSRDETLRCLSAKRVLPSSYSLINTWYHDLEPSTLDEHLKGRRIAILMIDCDAYSSAKRALDLAGPLLAERAVIFFDDWRLNDLDLKEGGEYRAFNEWRSINSQVRIDSFPRYNRKSEAFVLNTTQR